MMGEIMNLKKTTLKKIKKVNEAINQGADESLIIKDFFSRSPKRYSEWMSKYESYLNSQEIMGSVKPMETLKVMQVVEKPQTPQRIELVNSKEEYNAFKDLLSLHMAGKLVIKGSEENVTEKIVITKDTFKNHEIVQKTMRVSKELYEQLGTFSKLEGITKVEALNFAIKEMLEKYN